jgi:hypothetical protein
MATMFGAATFSVSCHSMRFAVLVVNFVDRADIQMIQCRGGLGFALKAAEGLRVFRYLVGQELEGNKPAELNIFGLVHHTHPATAELLDDAVVRDGLADHAQAYYGGRLGKSVKTQKFRHLVPVRQPRRNG